VVSYRNRDGVTVDLLAALHVAEKSYYDDLSRIFDGYDALLYEMIKDKAQRIVRGAESDSLISGFQRFLKTTLELEFQLDAIDYDRKNFIHADMDPETFFRLQRERGESIFTLMLRSLQHELEKQKRGEPTRQITIIDLFRILTSRDRSRELKLVLGRQFEDIEAQLAGIEGNKGSVILSERNRVAVEVLEKTIARGKRKIGIFYGAGHMPGIEEKLVRDLGFERTASEWKVAWDMSEKKPEAGEEPRKPSPARPRQERF
jgi:hypothetical protein